jgi:GH43 family beta-xylosidase
VLARRLSVEPLESRAMLSGSGLVGQYFHNTDFTGLAFERTEAVDFAWGTTAPAPGVQADSFSVRWIGQLEAKYSENYTLRTVSDEGVRLWVDGKLLVDNWTPHSATVNSATIALVAGQRYDVRLEYFDGSGQAQIRLQWMSPSQPLEAIPAEYLYEASQGLRGEYADDTAGSSVSVDPQIDFNWGGGAPAAGIDADNFRVAWAGYVRADFSELYTFQTLSDDGVRVWVGDELVIDHWTPHAAAMATGHKTLEAGKWYDLRVEYRDVVGDAEVELAWSSERQTGVGVFEVIAAESLRAAKHAPLYFTNPLGQGQDPWVIQWNGTYLHARSAGRSVLIDQAVRLEDIHRDDPASTTITAWTAPLGTNYSAEIWAPELHQLNGKWYIYVAASNGNNETHRMHVLERDDPNPMGAYVYKGELATGGWAIDGTVLSWQGQLYFIWSGWPGAVNGQQNLYIAPMSNPLTISGSRTLLSEPTAAWERHGMPINEGPEVLIHDGQLHIIYSGSGYWTQEYALGRLTYDASGSLLGPSNWVKAAGPVFQKTSAVVGVGHASFTKSSDGTQDWIVYHSHPSPGGDPDQRVIHIQPYAFNSAGTPNFGAPLTPGMAVEIPRGIPDANRVLLAGDYDANSATGSSDLAVLVGQLGVAMFPGSGADGAGDGFADGADFLVWQRQFGATAASAAATEFGAASALAVDHVTLEEIEIGTFQLLLTPTAVGPRPAVVRRAERSPRFQQAPPTMTRGPVVARTDRTDTLLVPLRDFAERDGETIAAASDAALELLFFPGIRE